MFYKISSHRSHVHAYLCVCHFSLLLSSQKSQKRTSKWINTWCLFSLSRGDLGSIQDLPGQGPKLWRIQILGLRLPAWKPLHGRPGPELQQLSGAPGHGGQSESSTWLIQPTISLCCSSAPADTLFLISRESPSRVKLEGMCKPPYIFVLNVV